VEIKIIIVNRLAGDAINGINGVFATIAISATS
jgi:hypothetical protein